jgi:hypothetical protein
MTETTTKPTFLQKLAGEQLALFFLIGLSLFIALARYHTYHEPLEHDITATAVIANEMRLGRPYFSDVWENKPPALYIVHIMAQSIFGYGRGSLFAINLTLGLLSLFGVYFAASSSGGNIVSGLWAAVFWTVTSGDLNLQANQPNTEAFMNAPLIWAFALLLSLDRSEGTARVLRAVLVGSLVALCSFYKPHSMVYGVLLGVGHMLFPPEATANGRKKAIKDVLIIGATGATAWFAFFVYFALTGRFQILYTTMFVYPRYYSGNIFWNLWNGFGSHLYPTQLHLITPLVFLTLAGGVIAWKSGMKRPWALLIAYAVATQFTIAAPGRFYIHYYQLWLPIIAVGAGWSIVLLGQAIKEQFSGWLPHVFAAIALLFMLPPEIWAYRMDPTEWSLKSYGGVYAASESLASNLNDVLQPEENLFVLGDEPNFYFITGRRPAVGVFFLQDIAGGPLAAEFSARMINDLNRKPPDLVVIQNSAIGPKTVGPKNARLGPDHPVRKWVSDNYCPVDINPHSFFTICAKPGSSLEQRPSYRRLAAILSANVH